MYPHIKAGSQKVRTLHARGDACTSACTPTREAGSQKVCTLFARALGVRETLRDFIAHQFKKGHLVRLATKILEPLHHLLSRFFRLAPKRFDFGWRQVIRLFGSVRIRLA